MRLYSAVRFKTYKKSELSPINGIIRDEKIHVLHEAI